MFGFLKKKKKPVDSEPSDDLILKIKGINEVDDFIKETEDLLKKPIEEDVSSCRCW